MELKDLLAHCAGEGASDLHLAAGAPPWLRIDGELRPASIPTLDDGQVLACIESCLDDAAKRSGFRAGKKSTWPSSSRGSGAFD